MKRILYLLFILVLTSVTLGHAQSMGTITENKSAMEVKAVVAVHSPGDLTLRFYLLPFQPSAAEIAKLQANDYFWLSDKATPDAKKWPQYCPYAWFELGWDTKEDIGDPKKASIFLYDFSIGGTGGNMSSVTSASDQDIAMSGAVKDGQMLELTSKGTMNVSTDKVGWDLKIKTKVLTLKTN